MSSPAVAIVHYHLRAGGVSKVIETSSAHLTRAGVPHVILSSGESSNKVNLPVAVLPQLNYDSKTPAASAQELAQTMRTAAAEALGTKQIVWHFHNHSLGKNRSLSAVPGILAESGEPLVLHYHDFAEDGRPTNYQRVAEIGTLYPCATNILHAFINSRDRNKLIAAGLPEPQAALLPNPLVSHGELGSETSSAGAPLVLYPVRGIRRKNLGELFLLAALAPQGARFAATLPPENPQWMETYHDWETFADSSKLPVSLGVADRISPIPGVDRDYASWIKHSSHFITTSIAEGFGLGFLEAAANNKPLIGRNLPMITDDLAANGITPGTLYDHLLIPESWVGLETYRQRLILSMRALLEQYGQPMSNTHLERSFSSSRRNRHFDFGNLPEDLQRKAIRRLLEGADSRQVLVETAGKTQALTDWLATSLQMTEPTVHKTQLETYSASTYINKLRSAYKHVADASQSPPRFLERNRVLGEFLQPGTFHFLRT